MLTADTITDSSHSDPVWHRQTSGYDIAEIGRYHVVVWTGSPARDLDDGYQICEVYVPTTDRQLPDGKMLVKHRRLDTRDRDMALGQALAIAKAAIGDHLADQSSKAVR
jgi:hypothetical protein